MRAESRSVARQGDELIHVRRQRVPYNMVRILIGTALH